jgi:putative oxidoreductase
MFRNAALLGSRLVLGSYLAVHGAQKLFGAFEGPGLEAAGGFFEKIGLTPGREMAILASASELGGGILTATGIAYPLGPLVIVGTMAVASVTHRENGPLATKGGYEHPLTNAATAAALAAAGPGWLAIGPPAPKSVVRLAGVVGAGLAGFSISKLLRPPPAAESPAGQADQADAVSAT